MAAVRAFSSDPNAVELLAKSLRTPLRTFDGVEIRSVERTITQSGLGLATM
jgi:hypothetical protein